MKTRKVNILPIEINYLEKLYIKIDQVQNIMSCKISNLEKIVIDQSNLIQKLIKDKIKDDSTTVIENSSLNEPHSKSNPRNEKVFKQKMKSSSIKKNKEIIMNTSPCLQKNKLKIKRISNQNIQHRKNKKIKDSRVKRKVLYMSEKPINEKQKKERSQDKTIKQSSKDIVPNILQNKSNIIGKQKKSSVFGNMAHRFSQELLSNQSKLECVKKQYLKKKSNIDNTLEKLKSEQFFSNNNQVKINYMKPNKFKKFRTFDDQYRMKNNPKNTKNKQNIQVSIQSINTMQRESNKKCNNLSLAGLKNKNLKKKLRIQKFDKKRGSKLYKIASNNDLQPKINIYHKVHSVAKL